MQNHNDGQRNPTINDPQECRAQCYGWNDEHAVGLGNVFDRIRQPC